MRILHVVPTYLPATRYGGPIVAVHGLCRALVARGLEVEVFTTNVDGSGTSDVPLGRAVDVDDVAVTYFPSPYPRLYWSPSMGTALRRDISRFDLVHLHSVFLWPTLAAARAAAARHVPYVVSPRGMLVPELVGAKSTLLKSAWIRLFERKTFRRAAAIHFTAERELHDALRLGIPVSASFIVPNGIDIPPALAPAHRRGILYLGRISWKKGLDRLIEALALVPGVHLTVAGNDEEDLAPKLRDLAIARGVGDRVNWVGPVRGEDKQWLLASAALLVLPSRSENFGNVLLEAMAEATPVVTTPEVGLSHEVLQAGAGLVVPGTAPELAGAIRTITEDPKRSRDMGERGRAAVERRFAWPHVAEEMERAYERVVRRAEALR